MKNIFKSLFISVFPVVALVIFTKTLIKSIFTTNTVSLLISSFAVVVFFSLLFLKPVARTTKTLLPYSSLLLIGLILSLFDFNKNTFIIQLLIISGWITYLTWYSSFKDRNTSVLKVGKILPIFMLEKSDKETIKSNSFTGNFKIFLFYRGNWCPLCMAQIKEIANQYKILSEKNIDVILVSSQPHKYTENLAKKHKVPFHFLVDTKNKAAKKLGILHTNGLPAGFQVFGYDSDVVLPTVIITDKNNKIIFADLTDNYRVRPEPETFIKIIEQFQH